MIAISLSLNRFADLSDVGEEGEDLSVTSSLLQILLPDLLQTLVVIFPIRHHLYKYDFLNGKIAKSKCSIK